MIPFAVALFALAYSGLVLFTVASSLRRLMSPMRAAVAAFLLSVLVHGATTLMLAEEAPTALYFWGIPHLLILPLLLLSARKQTPSTGA
ncbi:hypothetical protein [Falsiroseomonas tokyonensis]|uniref:Uncharacterized protein n=1 Tax=Falsiroseomonas tokyonensis TaxID=430521 RepID=A0ABV7BZ71_9PROT|nr:hypothetical protein [Falsiroseomonas tokyonensis]MBU8540694.1 hypothetical protein [Falsiroseomonas tokyonensis]